MHVEPREIVGSRVKTLMYLTISTGLVLVAFWLVRSPDGGGWIGWCCLFFFGLGVPVFGLMLIRPHRLMLDAEGFTLSGGLVRSPRQVRWCDTRGFFVHRLPRGGKMIGYTFVEGAKPKSLLGAINHRLGVDAALPKAWPGTPETMVSALNSYRSAALAAPTPPA